MADNGPGSHAAQLAAGQVEAIVAAAQLAAEKIRVEAERDATDRRLHVEEEVDRIVSEGLAEAERARNSATRDADELRNTARRETEAQRAEAQQEVDELRAEAAAELEKLRSEAEAEIREGREAARTEAQKAIDDAHAEAKRLVEEATAEAADIGAKAREEAQERIRAARGAADDALADARAVSEGLRKLGDMLGGHSERILRDVTGAHRRLAEELRIASTDAVAGQSSAGGRVEDGGGDGGRPREPGRGMPDLELPTWVDE